MTCCLEAENKLVQDYLRHAEERLARQRQVMASLSPESDLAELAQQVLEVLEESLERHRQHLAWVRLRWVLCMRGERPCKHSAFPAIFSPLQIEG